MIYRKINEKIHNFLAYNLQMKFEYKLKSKLNSMKLVTALKAINVIA